MRGLIIDGVWYVLYVETPLPVNNTNIIKSILYNKYAGEQINTILISVASSI